MHGAIKRGTIKQKTQTRDMSGFSFMIILGLSF